MEPSRPWEVLWATVRGLSCLGRRRVLILPVVRLARFGKTPQEADQFSGSVGGRGEGATGGRGVLKSILGTQGTPGSRAGRPYPGEWEMGPWESLH